MSVNTQDLFEVTSDALVLMSFEGEVCAVNDPFRTQLGYKDEDIVGKNWKSLVFNERKNLIPKDFEKGGQSWGTVALVRGSQFEECRVLLKIIRVEGGMLWVLSPLGSAVRTGGGPWRVDPMESHTNGLLHDICNVLSSVNVSIDLILDRVYDSPIGRLDRIVDDFERYFSAENQDRDDGRAQRVQHYFKNVVKALESEKSGVLHEISSLERQVGHLKTMISMQQKESVAGQLLERCPLEEIICEAVRRCHVMGMVREVEAMPEGRFERDQLLQILANLLNNAKDATLAATKDPQKIVVRAFPTRVGFVRIEVEDCGVGIAQEDREKMFSYGFTTKTEGHGFGLHRSRLLAEKMGGTLGVESEGLGQGATFFLEIPN